MAFDAIQAEDVDYLAKNSLAVFVVLQKFKKYIYWKNKDDFTVNKRLKVAKIQL